MSDSSKPLECLCNNDCQEVKCCQNMIYFKYYTLVLKTKSSHQQLELLDNRGKHSKQ